jgi:hypothetical protein
MVLTPKQQSKNTVLTQSINTYDCRADQARYDQTVVNQQRALRPVEMKIWLAVKHGGTRRA